MKNRKIDNVKVGLLVLAGLMFLILTLYMIGKNRNLFGPTFMIRASLTNVNGLVPGNNVRFKGMDVGTVKSIEVADDTSVFVTMTIDERMKPYIRRNAIATIGTDGLMGNKLVNIDSDPRPSGKIEQGDIIQSRKPVETDEMLRTLSTTNQNMERITHNLYQISVKLNNSESLWSLLADTTLARNLKRTVAEFRRAGFNAAELTGSAWALADKLNAGRGLAHTLFTDTTLSGQLYTSLDQIEDASHQTAAMLKDLQTVVDQMKQGDGAAGLILTDTVLRQSLLQSATNIEQATGRFNQNMEALRSNFLFRRYFRKLEKRQDETAEAKRD